MKNEGFGDHSDLSRTAFGTTPTEGLEVVDAYTEKSFKAFEPPSIKKENSVVTDFPGIKPNIINGMKTDKATSDYLASSKYTSLSQAITALKGVIPANVNVNSILEYIPLGTAIETATKMFNNEKKAYYDARHTDGSFFSELMLNITSLVDFASSDGVTKSKALTLAGSIADWFPADAYGGGTFIEGISGSGDYILAAVKKFGLAQMFIDSGHADGLIKWITEDDFLPVEVKQWLTGELAVSLGIAGLWAELTEAIEIAANRFTPAKRIATVRGILSGYVYAADMYDSQKPSLAADLIARIDAIDSTWDHKDRAGISTPNLRYFSYATEDALDVLTYSDRTRSAAFTFLSFSPEKESYKTTARRHYPYIVFTV